MLDVARRFVWMQRSTRTAPRSAPGGTRRQGSPLNSSQKPNTTQPRLEPAQRAQLKKKFKELDKNGDGKLTVVELREILQAGSKTRLTDREVKILFRQVDKDGNGTVDFDEFVDYLWSAKNNNTVDNIKDSDVVFEVELPLGGGNVQLGGKLGNVVTNPGFIPRLKTGWRAIAVNGEKLPAREVAQEIERLNRCWQRCEVIFEVDEQSGERMQSAMEDRIMAAQREFLEMFGCNDWADLDMEGLSDEAKSDILRDHRLPKLLVDAKGVFAALALLDIIPGSGFRERKELIDAVLADDVATVARIIGPMAPQELLVRDGDGNTPLHLAKGEACVNLLVRKCPEAQMVLNNAGRNPLNERLARLRKGLRFDLLAGTCENPGDLRDILLLCDDRNICAAMRVVSADFEGASRELPTWEQTCEALDKRPEKILPALEHLGGPNWPGLIGFHCFREAMQEGCHTSHTWSRLRTLWCTLRRLLEGCQSRDDTCLAPAKALLRASKGPCCPPIDMRLPYRKDLMTLMTELEHDSGAEVARQYDHLSGRGATWLKHDLEDDLSNSIMPNSLVKKGLQPRLRMDFQLESGTAAPSMLVPDWIQSDKPDFAQILADLASVGAVSGKPEDAVYEMLRLAGMGEDVNSDKSNEDAESIPLIRLYCAFLRGVCDMYKDTLTQSVLDALGGTVVPGRSFFSRTEVKGFPRICVKAMEALAEIKDEIKKNGLDRNAEVDFLLQRCGAFVNDINGCTVVGNSPEEMKELVAKLQEAMPVLRVKNTYRETAIAADYRDIKIWPCIETDIGHLLVEVQVILAEGYEAKKWMHLPYAFKRGDFDWHHGSGLSIQEQFFMAWRLYTGIEGSYEDDDFNVAKKFCTKAATGGHLVARAICRKEGWGKFRKDERKAMSDFEEAAEAGLPEAKTKIGVSLVNAMSNITTNMRRGAELLREAAAEGELEAIFQLGIIEGDYRAQKALLQKAANLGHQRAVRHPLIASNAQGKTKLSSLVDV